MTETAFEQPQRGLEERPVPEKVGRGDGRGKDERRQKKVTKNDDVGGKVLRREGVDQIDAESDGGGRNEAHEDEEVGDAIGDDELLDDPLPARQPVDVDARHVLTHFEDLDLSVGAHVDAQTGRHDEQELPVELCRQ